MTKSKWISWLFLLLFSFISLYIINYGLNWGFCNYTEKELPVRPELRDTTLILEKDAYLASGVEPEICSPVLKNIDYEIVESEEINNITIGKRYFLKQGRSIDTFKKGQEFSLVNMIALTQHGISTIDSGPGPDIYLILKDAAGITYAIATQHLGFDEEESLLGYYRNGLKQGQLSWTYFRE